eukprot:752196-Amphidinium_carterae.1
MASKTVQQSVINKQKQLLHVVHMLLRFDHGPIAKCLSNIWIRNRSKPPNFCNLKLLTNSKPSNSVTQLANAKLVNRKNCDWEVVARTTAVTGTVPTLSQKPQPQPRRIQILCLTEMENEIHKSEK